MALLLIVVQHHQTTSCPWRDRNTLSGWEGEVPAVWAIYKSHYYHFCILTWLFLCFPNLKTSHLPLDSEDFNLISVLNITQGGALKVSFFGEESSTGKESW